MENNQTATATTYALATKLGIAIRRASRVIFSDGFQVDFMDLMPIGQAIAQAIEFRRRDAARALASLKVKAQAAANPATRPNWIACHCGEAYSKLIERCPFCFCGASQDCTERRLAEQQQREQRESQDRIKRDQVIARQVEREANCSHQFVDAPRPGHRSGLHHAHCSNGCGAVETIDTSD